MKMEISIEEKAKRYDEAIKKAKYYYDEGKTIEFANYIASDIFPELKDSEDEKIRKDIISHFAKGIEGSSFDEVIEKYKIWIAWLEKQGERMSDPRYSILDKLIEADGIYQMAMNDAMVQEAKTKAIDALSKLEIGKLLEIEKQGEQKPVWSEEDSPYYDDICEILINLLHSETADVNKDAVQKDLDWLNSLKDRVQPQLKQEWSEKDEKMLKDTIRFCELCGNKVSANWLKSLKQKYTWKPSDEHYELEEFAKIVRSNLTGISKAVQELFEAKYLQLTGNKMYQGFKD